jgi:hypothetical protein
MKRTIQKFSTKALRFNMVDFVVADACLILTAFYFWVSIFGSEHRILRSSGAIAAWIAGFLLLAAMLRLLQSHEYGGPYRLRREDLATLPDSHVPYPYLGRWLDVALGGAGAGIGASRA